MGAADQFEEPGVQSALLLPAVSRPAIAELMRLSSALRSSIEVRNAAGRTLDASNALRRLSGGGGIYNRYQPPQRRGKGVLHVVKSSDAFLCAERDLGGLCAAQLAFEFLSCRALVGDFFRLRVRESGFGFFTTY